MKKISRKNLFDITEKIALITGSSRGLGLILARGLGEAGATLILNGRNRETLNRAVTQLNQEGLTAYGYAFNVTNRKEIQDAIEHINLGLLKNAGLSFKKEVIVTGGCARSSLVRKILADILDMRVLYLKGDSRADYADAWLAGKGVGVFSDYRLMKKKLKILDTYEPDPELHGYYCNIFETVYKELYPCLKNLFQ
ncbi:unnamed protein product, partial [marine sediment metagenome]